MPIDLEYYQMIVDHKTNSEDTLRAELQDLINEVKAERNEQL